MSNGSLIQSGGSSTPSPVDGLGAAVAFAYRYRDAHGLVRFVESGAPAAALLRACATFAGGPVRKHSPPCISSIGSSLGNSALCPRSFLIQAWAPGARRGGRAVISLHMAASCDVARLMALFLALARFAHCAPPRDDQRGDWVSTLAAENGWDPLTGGQLTFLVFCLLFWFAVKVPLFPIHPGSRRPTEAPSGQPVDDGAAVQPGIYGIPLRVLCDLSEQTREALTPLLPGWQS